VEAYCSKAGFVKALKKEIIGKSKDSIISTHINKETTNLKSKVLAKAYRAGDKVVCKTIRKGMKKLGAAAASTVVTVAPECIVLGGGVMEAMGEELLPTFQESFEKHLFGIDASRITVRLSELKDYAVAVGATILAKNKGKA
jgi:glucokinase